jgi:hypothetical protein
VNDFQARARASCARRRSLYVDRLKRIAVRRCDRSALRIRRKSGLRGQPKTYSRHHSSMARHISKLPVASEIIDRRPKCARPQRATLSPGNKQII